MPDVGSHEGCAKNLRVHRKQNLDVRVLGQKSITAGSDLHLGCARSWIERLVGRGLSPTSASSLLAPPTAQADA